MESNINHTVIKAYSKKFADTLAKEFFAKNNNINGAEILAFCAVKQVNFFILKTLFDQWTKEIDQLKSPYFNFQDEEVQMSIQSMMNVLSNHILIDEHNFVPLLQEACYKSLLLIFSPYEFYLQEINQPDRQQLSIDDLIVLKKYIKINHHLLQAYIDRFQDDGIQAIFSEDAAKIFDEVCENIKDTPEDFEAYQQAFSDILLLDLNEVYSPDDGGEIDASDTHNINEQFKTDKSTLLDKIGLANKENRETTSNDLPSKGLKKSITINQRFMFVNELFHGDKDEFEMVINYLDNCRAHQEAMDFLQDNYVKKKNWDLQQEEVEEFFNVIAKNFPSV